MTAHDDARPGAAVSSRRQSSLRRTGFGDFIHRATHIDVDRRHTAGFQNPGPSAIIAGSLPKI